jgi:hypothetical protein
MISDIKSAILAKLKELYPDNDRRIRRYTDDIPQNFVKPAFVIFTIDHDYSKRLSAKYNGRISFDIAYFSDKPSQEIKSDCLTIQETLLREFDLIGTTNKFRVLNKNTRITDNVLHFTFDINYSEMKVEERIPMQTQQTNTSI